MHKLQRADLYCQVISYAVLCGKLKNCINRSIKLILQPQIISNHCDKFRISGLSPTVLDGVAEVGIKGIHVSSIPRDFNCVANCTLNTACGGLVLFCNRRIKHLCDRIYNLRILNREKYCRAQILISLYVCGNAYLVDNFCNLCFYI